MIQVAIVDDNAKERKHLRDCLDYITEKDGTLFSVREFASGEDFLGAYTPVYDIVLMDIEMTGIDGVETARHLRRVDETVVLVFVTRMTQFAVRGYEVDALDFLVKPVGKFSFALKMSRAIARAAVRGDNLLMLRIDGELTSIRLNTLKYVESDGHYVVYHTLEGDYREYASLKSVEDRVGENFVRCNSGYLVNLRYVTGVKKNTVVIDKDELQISRPKKVSFLSALTKYLSGGGAR